MLKLCHINVSISAPVILDTLVAETMPNETITLNCPYLIVIRDDNTLLWCNIQNHVQNSRTYLTIHTQEQQKNQIYNIVGQQTVEKRI